jgi:superfamily II DNA or RNA helicase
MEKVHIASIDEAYIRVSAEPSTKMELSEHFCFEVPGAKFMPAVKNKIWDGKIRLFNSMTGLIYKGLAAEVVKFCKSRDYDVSWDDNVFPANPVPEDIAYELAKEFQSGYEPREYQARAVYQAIKYNRGLFLSPTASGKSFTIYLIARFIVDVLEGKVLVIVPTTTLVSQMSGDFIDYNQKNSLPIHQIMGGKPKDDDSPYFISTWQSIYKMPAEWFDQFDCIIVDEAHLAKAKSITAVMEKSRKAKFRYGFTGTLDDSLTNEMTLNGLFGPTMKVTTTKKLIEDDTLSAFEIKSVILKYPPHIRKGLSGKSYQEEIDWLVSCESRNRFIANLAQRTPGNNLVLFQFVEKHGKVLLPMIEAAGDKPVHMVYGGVTTEDREAIRKLVEAENEQIILASYQTFSTGVNITNLDNLIMASPSKSKIRNLQSIGRVLRKKKNGGKNEACLYDLADDLKHGKTMNYASLHFAERCKIYKSEGFKNTIYAVDLKVE